MTDTPLGIPERSALLALMTLVSAAANSELKDRYGFTIGKPVRQRLVGEGYLTATQTARRAYIHELTDKGWARCRDELTNPLPAGAQRGYRVLYGVLESLHRYLAATGLTLADFFAPQVTTDNAAPVPGDQVRAAYDEFAGRPGAWVQLTRLRAALPGVPRPDFDEALRQLDLSPHVSLIPEVNQKTLTAADHEAAIHIGGEDKHLLQIRPG